MRHLWLLVDDEVLKLCHAIITRVDATLQLMHEVVAVDYTSLYIGDTVLHLAGFLLELFHVTLLEFLDLDTQL